jgi:hypothetical protein
MFCSPWPEGVGADGSRSPVIHHELEAHGLPEGSPPS